MPQVKTTPFSVRLDANVRARIEKEARRRNRTASFIANNAIKRYFDGFDAFQKEVDDAFKEAEKGVFISGEAMHAWIESWDTENELPPPKPDVVVQQKSKKKVA